MLRVGRYVFKRAETSEEFEAIHRLNYQTFVDEIHQYAPSDGGRLVDKYHDKNVYFLGFRDDKVVGMISAHSHPPFSVASRLSNPAILEGPGIRPLEVRLLAVEPDERNSIVLLGLLWSFYKHARDDGYTDLFISGIEDRVAFYRRLGFEPLGPAVASGNASFVPMSVCVSQLQNKVEHILVLLHNHVKRHTADEVRTNGANGSNGSNGAAKHVRTADEPVCLLPGPVALTAAVRRAFEQAPIYHRGAEFIERFEKVRRRLGEMVGGRDVALFNGSGTLGNEVVGATLAAEPGPGRGVMLVNGEFGQRLARQAVRFGFNPRILEWPWGKPWDLDQVEAALAEEPERSWVWGVHQESSTGVLNDLPGLVERAHRRGSRVCVDCISSLGAVPLDLRGVHLATGATGKALGSYAGLAIVFADRASLAGFDPRRVPSYLDLPATLATTGPRCTFPSSVVLALEAALADYATPELARFKAERYAALGAYVRRELRKLGLEPMAEDRHASPVVTTFAPPHGESTADFVARCRSWGFAIGGQSGYLAEQRLVQIATMGAVLRKDCEPLFEHLERYLSRKTPLAG